MSKITLTKRELLRDDFEGDHVCYDMDIDDWIASDRVRGEGNNDINLQVFDVDGRFWAFEDWESPDGENGLSELGMDDEIEVFPVKKTRVVTDIFIRLK